MKVALIHYWLVGMRGGEKVLEQLCELFPDADIFTHVLDPNTISKTILRHDIRTTFIQSLPYARRLYQRYLPLMPMALENLDLRDYDLVISSESGPAKGVIAAPNAMHICYCHSPMRYLWSLYHEYQAQCGAGTRWMMRPLAHYLRLWDVVTASRVDHFVANSAHVGRQIQRYYHKPSEVVHPPVDVSAFRPSNSHDGFYLLAGQLVPYKRTDLAVETFNRLGLPLVVIGGGRELARLRRLARPNVRIMGPQSFAVLRDHYSRCKALIFPGEEDFGIVPVEAMASGKPVVALARGGVLETVIPGVTGVLFREPTVDCLAGSVEALEMGRYRFVGADLVRHARQFDVDVFKTKMRRVIAGAIGNASLAEPAAPRALAPVDLD